MASNIWQTDYDNPSALSGVLDSSGIRIFYTPSLRTHTAGLLEFGLRLGAFQFIPSGMAHAVNSAFCMSECTETLPDEGVSVFSVFLHAHTLGTALELKHIRNGEELAPIAANWAYDFDYQQSTPLSENVQILPGDSLQLDCFYDSSDAQGITYGGDATTQEMCQAYVYAYPRPTLTKCTSSFTNGQINGFYQLAADAGYLTGDGVENYEYALGGEAFEFGGVRFENGIQMYDALWNSRCIEQLATRTQKCQNIAGEELLGDESGVFEIAVGYTPYNAEGACLDVDYANAAEWLSDCTGYGDGAHAVGVTTKTALMANLLIGLCLLL